MNLQGSGEREGEGDMGGHMERKTERVTVIVKKVRMRERRIPNGISGMVTVYHKQD